MRVVFIMKSKQPYPFHTTARIQTGQICQPAFAPIGVAS